MINNDVPQGDLYFKRHLQQVRNGSDMLKVYIPVNIVRKMMFVKNQAVFMTVRTTDHGNFELVIKAGDCVE